MTDKRAISVVTSSGAAAIRLKCLDFCHSAPSQPVRLSAVAGARCRGHFDLFEPPRRRSLGKARVAGDPGKSHVAGHVVSPMAAFLSFGCLISHD